MRDHIWHFMNVKSVLAWFLREFFLVKYFHHVQALQTVRDLFARKYIKYFFVTGSLVGSVVNWNTASWNITNFVITDTIANTDPCIPYPNKTYMVFPERRDIDSAFSLCQRMGNLERFDAFSHYHFHDLTIFRRQSCRSSER